ncbi:MAG: CRISPR-associated helicase Cas3' [Pseudomonadota bacterium]
MKKSYVAHIRTTDKKEQTLEQHLFGVSSLTASLTAKIGLYDAGQLLGLMHDFGKYSRAFQDYIESATGKLNPDIDDNYVDAKELKGKIDHSSAGAQWVWNNLRQYGKNGQGELCGQILALCIASHHSGIIDCLKPEGGNGFIERMKKADNKTNFTECMENANDAVLTMAGQLAGKKLITQMIEIIKNILRTEQHGQNISDNIHAFYLGFFSRFLFSCLIDADRINSADFETPENAYVRNRKTVPWSVAIERLEDSLLNLASSTPIDHIRRDISDSCYANAKKKQGIYTLTVPTGGGKTYASLRFALHHAYFHKLDRIIYIIPYTSIIEQNADAIRKVIEDKSDEFPWVLEHHSNLDPENQTWHNKLVSDNWDSPIILTTMVQLLETLFSGGTRGVRRLHQLANSVLIFDEIQTLPINCTHIFCNAINFLTEYAKTTTVLCTATQPLLDELRVPNKGQLFISKENEIIGDVGQLFKDLKRVNIINNIKTDGWTEEEIVALAISEFTIKNSCLVIVNTKAWAQCLYLLCQFEIPEDALFHLSTNQCPAHRKHLLDKIRERLYQQLPVLCISTQLIEAGVDIDFASVIRFLAGLDSIAQAAGRCNRSGNLPTATVYVINPITENIDLLKDIKVGQEKTLRVFSELQDGDLLAPEKIKRYFQYYFYDRANEMDYPLSAKQASRNDSLLNLLCGNQFNPAYQYRFPKLPLLQQSFMTAGNAFKAIDAPTHSVIVQYGDGKHLVTELCAIAKEFDAHRYYALLRKAQKYSVNIFPNVWNALKDENALYEIQGEGVYFLDERYYSDDFGLSTEPVGKLSSNIC